MHFVTLAAGLSATFASVASAHSLFSNLHINGVDQGDGACVRMPKDGETATNPIAGLTSNDMACGRDGQNAAPYVCSAPGSAKLTFEFRSWPDATQTGSIDISHKGPCAVYVKKVNDMFKDSATGPGWFKIWEQGYDESTKKWCTEVLIENNGLISIELPSGLPSGSYLVRPELLALHQSAAPKNDPQYYAGCAQVFIQDGPSGDLSIPAEFRVSIPGYIDGTEPGNTFDIYNNPKFPYPIPGPKVYSPKGTSNGVKTTVFAGAVPADCLLKNGNWCGVAIKPYSSETGCWAGVEECYAQGEKCYTTAPPTGIRNCNVWNAQMCKALESACGGGKFTGPPAVSLKAEEVPLPGAIPAVSNPGAGTPGAGSDSGSGSGSGSPGAVPTTTAAPKPTTTPSPVDTVPADTYETTPAPTATKSASPPTASDGPSQGGDDGYGGGDNGSDAGDGAEEEDGAGQGASKVSTDGKCGGAAGTTCQGSGFGDCCSKSGKCGSKKVHCGCGCQAGFGLCRDN